MADYRYVNVSEMSWMPPRPDWLMQLINHEDKLAAPCWKPTTLDDGTPAFERCDGALVFVCTGDDPADPYAYWYAAPPFTVFVGPLAWMGPQAAVLAAEEHGTCTCWGTLIGPTSPEDYALAVLAS